MPQQNGIAEYKYRYLLEMTRALCFSMYIPNPFWAEIVMTSAFLINWMSLVFLIIRPIWGFCLFLTVYFLHWICLKVFECVCYVHVHTLHRDKLDPRVLKCVFLGYPSTHKGCQYFHLPTRKYYIFIDVQFYERESYFFGDIPLTLLQEEISNEKDEKFGF